LLTNLSTEMYPYVKKLELVDGTFIIPVKKSVYELIVKVAKKRAYIKAFLKANPHLSDIINDDFIVINDDIIKWKDMIEIMEVTINDHPHNIQRYCKKPIQQKGSTVSYYYDYWAKYYQYYGIGYTTVQGMWVGIFTALRKPEYILIWKK